MGLRKGQGKRGGVERGAVVTWKILYSGAREEKAQGQRPQTMQTKHSLCSTAKQKVPEEARSPGTTALRSCRGGPGMPFPATPLLVAQGRLPSVTVTGREGAYEVRAPTSGGVTLCQGLRF